MKKLLLMLILSLSVSTSWAEPFARPAIAAELQLVDYDFVGDGSGLRLTFGMPLDPLWSMRAQISFGQGDLDCCGHRDFDYFEISGQAIHSLNQYFKVDLRGLKTYAVAFGGYNKVDVDGLSNRDERDVIAGALIGANKPLANKRLQTFVEVGLGRVASGATSYIARGTIWYYLTRGVAFRSSVENNQESLSVSGGFQLQF